MAFYGRVRDNPFRERDNRGPFGFEDRDRYDRPYRDDRRLLDSRGRFDDRGGRRTNDLAAKFRGADDLASKQLQIEAKKFYVDVKENKRGRFFKISEVSSTGQRNRIVFDFAAASDFHEQLTNFIEFFSTNDGTDSANEKLKSEVIHAGDRRYYLDLKANSRGKFLKVALTMPPPSNERQQIVIPAHGMADLRDALTELLSEYGSSTATTTTVRKSDLENVKKQGKMDESTEADDHRLSLSADNKKFFFQVISGNDGHCLQISEVTQSFRTQINIPEKAWPDFIEKLHAAGASISNTGDHCDEQQLSTDNSDKKSVENWDFQDDTDTGKECVSRAEPADDWSDNQQNPTIIGAGGDGTESPFPDQYQDADYIIC